jgi:hypothetical protein
MFTPRFELRAALAATATIGLVCLAGCGSEPTPAAGSTPTLDWVLKDIYGMRAQQTNDYGQTTWVVKDGNRWIGFLLSGNTRDAKIELIEVSVGRQPGLLRDGC